MSDEQLTLADVRKKIDGIRTAMLTTPDETGELSSRPLTIQDVNEEGHVAFVVGKDSDWVTGRPTKANLAISDDDVWVSIAGTLTFSDDPKMLDDLWDEMTDAFFENGKADATVAHLDASTWEYWTAPNKLTQAFRIGKAVVTGGKTDLGQSGTIET